MYSRKKQNKTKKQKNKKEKRKEKKNKQPPVNRWFLNYTSYNISSNEELKNVFYVIHVTFSTSPANK